MGKLKKQVIFRTSWFLILLGAVLFLTAWTFDNWQAWVYRVTLSAVIVLRMIDEEKILMRNLPGYDEYFHTVHYRLIPRIW